MDVTPVGAKQKAPLRLAELRQIARHAIAHAIEHAAGRSLELRGDKLQQRGLAGAGLPHHRDHLAGMERKGDVAATELLAVPLAQAFRDEKRPIGVALRHGAPAFSASWSRSTCVRFTRKLKPWRSNPSDS